MARPEYRGRAWQTVRAAVLARDGWRCQICAVDLDPNARPRTRYAAVVDHVVPVSAGGAWHDPANLRAACHPCNTTRANQSRRRHRYPVPRLW